MDTLPKWLDELVDQILKSDEFVCKHIEDYLNGRIDNLGIARLFDLVGCLIDKVEDTQSLLNKSLDRVAQSSVELSRANQQLKRQETEIERIQNRLTETQCQLATKENELSMAETEIERLRVLIEGYKAMEKTMKREVSELDNEAEDEIARLNRQLDAAAVLLRRPERVTWGYDSEHRVMAYFLDGNYAGDTLRDVILAAATRGV